MEHRSFANSIAALVRRKPFKPFTIKFVDGDKLLVEHPEAVRYQGQGTAVFFGKKGELTLFDHDGVARIAQHSRSGAA